MPNICDFTIKAVGTKESLDALDSILKNNYHYCDSQEKIKEEEKRGRYKLCYSSSEETLFTNYPKHMYRVFEADVCEQEQLSDDTEYRIWFGNCAWSVYCCMFDGPSTYYGTYSENDKNDEKSLFRKEHTTTLPQISQEHNLKIEVYSCEPGMCFAEHYLIKNGEIVTEEEFEYREYSKYDEEINSKEDMEKLVGRSISDSEWDEEEYFIKCEINPSDPYWHI